MLLARAAWGADCAPCHAQASGAHAKSPHALAMQTWEKSVFAAQAKPLVDRFGFRYEFGEGKFRVGKAEAEIRWVMGSGQKAQTLLLEKQGVWTESRLSWYRAGSRMGLSPGHSTEAPLDDEDALGVRQSEGNLRRCLGCHSTDEKTPGIQCARCHPAAERHAREPGLAVPSKAWSAGTQAAFCGQCHRSPDREFRSKTPELEDPLSVRFSTIGFTASRCYDPKGSFGCLSCHDAHSQQVKAEAGRVCAGCHVQASRRGCARTEGKCFSCHLRQSTPVPNLRFTDHRIR